MQSTDTFKETIENYVNQHAVKNPSFKTYLENKKKNINDCVTYILNEVKKSGCNGFADDEIFGMALHYYEEENIDVGGKINSSVVVNHAVENEQYKAYKINKAEEKYLKDYISRVSDKEHIKTLKIDLENLKKTPLKYWESLDLESYKSDPDNQERYEEVKFMLDYYKKAKPKATNKRATNSKTAKKTTVKKQAVKKPKAVALPPVKLDKNGQASLF